MAPPLQNQSPTMLELIKACYEIRALQGRQGLGIGLSAADEAALRHLDRVFGTAGTDTVALRLDTRAPLSFKLANGHDASGMVINISATGAFVETRTPLRLGERTTLRIRDSVAAREYHFSVEVMRVARHGMGVRFVGIPVECRYHPSAPRLTALSDDPFASAA